MAQTANDSGVAEKQAENTLKFEANGQDRIELPSANFIADAHMTRDGDDLVLTTPDGQTATVENYFSADPAPLLQSPDGSVLTPNLVNSFARSAPEFAANDTASDESPVGAVEEVKGNATVTRADGTVETIAIGTPIYQGDIIETDAAGAVNITFIDETSMAISENARLAVDQYTFDPATESGTTNFSVLRGLFVFTSGLIGRDDPDDVKIDTPVGSIGIRGTIIAGEINPAGESKISVLEGAIVVTNGTMETTLSQAFETVKLGGFDQPMQNMGVVPANDISARFSSIGAVSPSLFTTINDTAGEQSSAQPTQNQPTRTEAAPGSEPVQQNAPSEPAAAPQSANQPAQQPAPALSSAAETPAVQQTIAPPPSAINSGIATLNGSSTGLPTASTIAGETSSLPTGSQSGANTAAFVSPASGTIAPPVVIAATAGTQNTAPVAITSSIGETVQPPPAVIAAIAANTATPGTVAPPVFALSYNSGNIVDTAHAGAVIGTISAGVAGVMYSLVNSTPYYQLVANGNAVDVQLTTAGEQFFNSSFSTPTLANIQIQATETSSGLILTQNFTPSVGNANASNTESLDGGSANISIIADNLNNNIGYSISALGDINNDGFDDFIFSNDVNAAGQNHSYIAYGSNTHLASSYIGLPGNIGVIANPSGGGNFSNTIVTGIGDFNGDGTVDYAIGQQNNNISGVNGTGFASIISGANPTSVSTFTSGLFANGDFVGSSIQGIGDFNNDGRSDVIIGAAGDTNAYLVKGSSTWGILNGNATAVPTLEGGVVSALGDYNGDGYADFAIGSPSANSNNGKVTLYYGNENGTVSTTETLNGYTGSLFGEKLFAAGDINGDGYSDLIVGAYGREKGYVYLGGTGSAADAEINLSGLESGTVYSGAGSVGDFNGDGYDDFVLATENTATAKFHSFVVFGRENFSGAIDVNYLKNPDHALELTTGHTLSNGNGIDIQAVGDINGDGYDDFAMGAADINSAAAGNGGMYVIYGRGDASPDANVYVGTSGNNVMEDYGDNGIVMRGGAGNDTFKISNTNFLGIDGGSGDNDRILIQGANSALNFSGVNYESISGIEKIEFSDASQRVTLSLENLFNLLKTSDSGSLYIEGGAGNIFAIDSSIVAAGSEPTNAEISDALGQMTNGTVIATNIGAHTQFQIGGYSLYIDNQVSVQV